MNYRRFPLIIALVVGAGLVAVPKVSHAQWGQPSEGYRSQEERLSALEQAISILEKSDPARDLRSALSKKDARFVGYNGYGAVVPGLTHKQLVAYMRKRLGFKFLSGSSDLISVSLSERLHKVSKTYMEPYNKGILKYLAGKSK